MSPTIVLKDGKPIMSVGAAGGPTIITQTLQAIVNVIDFKMDLGEALEQPRIHHQWSPDELKIETKAGDAILAELEKRGHKLDRSSSFGACQAVRWDESTKSFHAAHDPRVPGKADGW
jgi:gamma-glutamyltranspeptidase/glutathione hydrolase